MKNEIYQILKKHKLPLKKREEVLTDLLLLFNVSGAKPKLVCPKCGAGEENHKRMGEHAYCCECEYEWNWG